MNEDLIRRSDVIEITAETGALETQRRVKALPTIEPKRGEWIATKEVAWGALLFQCSECGVSISDIPISEEKPKFPYCPWCGADMRGKDNE